VDLKHRSPGTDSLVRSAACNSRHITGSVQVIATDYAEIVAALRAVPGVAGADVVPDEEGGGLGLLRLALSPGVDEVQVASRVGRVLRERFGLGVDADQVQLIEDAETLDVSEQSGHRPVISRMQLVSSGLDVSASVSLTFQGRVVRGESTGTATQSGVQRAVAAAALHAVEQLIDSKARFELEHVEVTISGRDRTALVSVTMVSSAGTDRLTGSAMVREDARQAVIRAVLDAVNRRLEPLLV
jgi:ribosomal protein S11